MFDPFAVPQDEITSRGEHFLFCFFGGNAGLFQRAVLMSGSALSPWALNHQAGWLKAEVARQMDCGPLPVPESLADIGDCLRKRPLDSLLAVRLPATPRFCPTFAPFVDGAGIVAVEPLQAMQSTSQDFARIPLIAGVTSVESYRHTGYYVYYSYSLYVILRRCCPIITRLAA